MDVTEIEQTAEAPATTVDAGKKSRPRNYSFQHRNPETLDTIEIDGVEITIPAGMGTTYWAILKALYENANKTVTKEILLARVDELMKDRDEEGWAEYCAKENTTVHRRLQGKSAPQKIKTWQERIINNTKTLTRKKDYGKRLHERGHELVYKANGGNDTFKLVTNSENK